MLLVLDEGDPAHRRRRRWPSSPRSAPVPSRSTSTRRAMARPPQRRVRALEPLIRQGIRRRHHGDRRPVVGAARPSTTTTRRRPQRVARARWWRRPTSRTPTPTGPASTSPGPASPARAGDRGDRFYYRRRGTPVTRTVLAHGGALSHHHGVGLNRSRFVAQALGPGLRRAGLGEAGPRPQRHPQPGQARPALAVRPVALAVISDLDLAGRRRRRPWSASAIAGPSPSSSPPSRRGRATSESNLWVVGAVAILVGFVRRRRGRRSAATGTPYIHGAAALAAAALVVLLVIVLVRHARRHRVTIWHRRPCCSRSACRPRLLGGPSPRPAAPRRAGDARP